MFREGAGKVGSSGKHLGIGRIFSMSTQPRRVAKISDVISRFYEAVSMAFF